MVCLIFNYTCLWQYGVCTRVQVLQEPEASNLKELKLQGVVGLQTWELGTEFKAFERAI